MKDDVATELTKLASEMVRMIGMPDMDFLDYVLPKRTSRAVRRKILSVVSMAQRQAHSWGVRIVKQLDREKE